MFGDFQTALVQQIVALHCHTPTCEDDNETLRFTTGSIPWAAGRLLASQERLFSTKLTSELARCALPEKNTKCKLLNCRQQAAVLWIVLQRSIIWYHDYGENVDIRTMSFGRMTHSKLLASCWPTEAENKQDNRRSRSPVRRFESWFPGWEWK